MNGGITDDSLNIIDKDNIFKLALLLFEYKLIQRGRWMKLLKLAANLATEPFRPRPKNEHHR